jgi:hypothetical protein
MVDIFEENLLPENSLDFNNINKAALGKVSGAVVDRVMSGDEDPLKVYIKAKAITEVANGIIKDIKSVALDEAEKYGSEEASMLGCPFVVKNGPTSYEFDHDQEWCKLSIEMANIKEQIKRREKKMIDAMNYAEVVDEETGEVIPPAKIKRAGASILAVTIPRE